MKTRSIAKAAHKHFSCRTNSRNPILSFPLFSEFCCQRKDKEFSSCFEEWSWLEETVIEFSVKYATFLILPSNIKSGGKNKNEPFRMMYRLIRVQSLPPKGGRCIKLARQCLAMWSLESPPGQEETSLFRVCLLPSPGLYVGSVNGTPNVFIFIPHLCEVQCIHEHMFEIVRNSHHKFILVAYLGK